MNRNQTSKRSLSGVVGFVLFAIGTAVLVCYSVELAWQFYGASTSADSLGCWGSIGLASLHAFRLVMLDHAALLSAGHRILVLCSALIMTLIGMALLRKQAAGVKASGRSDLPTPPKGGQ
jgi:hypothetical protein